MIHSLLLALTLLATDPAPAPDQTADAALLLDFLTAVKSVADGKAKAMLARGAFLGDYAQKQPQPFAEFATYARACKLRRIELVNTPDGRPMPISVEWTCLYPEQDRNASFWFTGRKISRIGWGKPPVLRVSPTPRY